MWRETSCDLKMIHRGDYYAQKNTQTDGAKASNRVVRMIHTWLWHGEAKDFVSIGMALSRCGQT